MSLVAKQREAKNLQQKLMFNPITTKSSHSTIIQGITEFILDKST